MRVAGTSAGCGGFLVLVVGLWLLASGGPAGAQFFGGVEDAPRPPGNVPGTVSSPPPAVNLLPPSSGPTGRGDRVAPPTGPVLQSLPPPNVNPVPAPAQAVPPGPAGQAVLAATARFGHDMAVINGGLIWRIYGGKPDQGGAFRLLKEDKGATP